MPSKKSNGMILSTAVVIMYMVFTYFFLSYMFSNGLLFSIKADDYDLSVKFLCDFILGLSIVLIIILVYVVRKKPLDELGLRLKSPFVSIGLLVLYMALFIARGDFTARGFYTAFFYLIVIAFSEEFVYRGFLYTAWENNYGFWIAAIVSGALFGIPHAFIPSIVGGGNVFIAMLTLQRSVYKFYKQ